MKLILTLILMLPSLAWAESKQIPWQCQNANTVVVYQFSDWDIYPASTYVKEGDKVCVIMTATGDRGATFNIEGLAVGGSVKKGQERVFSFIARKVGRHQVRCVGTCNEAQSFIEVMSKASYEKTQNELNKLNSIQSRPTQILRSN